MKIFSTIAGSLGALALALILSPGASAAGLGISPTSIEVSKLLRGGHFEKQFVLSRAEAKEDLGFSITADGELQDWVTTNYGESFIFPAGQQRFPFVVVLNIPEDAANGAYQDRIRLLAEPVGDQGDNGVAFAINAAIDAQITVSGDQVLKYDIESLQVPSIEEGSALNIVLGIKNEGNVAAKPKQVKVELYDQFETFLLEEHTIDDLTEFAPVAAFATDDIILSVPNALGLGQYWLAIKAYGEDGSVYEDKAIFDIVEVGSLAKQGKLSNLAVTPQKLGKGDIAKISGTFENTGQVSAIATLYAEVYKGDKLVFAGESPQRNVMHGQSKDLVLNYTAETSGDLVVKAWVGFSGEETAQEEILLSVAGFNIALTGYIGGGASAIILAVLLIGKHSSQSSQKGSKSAKSAKPTRSRSAKKKNAGVKLKK